MLESSRAPASVRAEGHYCLARKRIAFQERDSTVKMAVCSTSEFRQMKLTAVFAINITFIL